MEPTSPHTIHLYTYSILVFVLACIQDKQWKKTNNIIIRVDTQCIPAGAARHRTGGYIGHTIVDSFTYLNKHSVSCLPCSSCLVLCFPSGLADCVGLVVLRCCAVRCLLAGVCPLVFYCHSEFVFVIAGCPQVSLLHNPATRRGYAFTL